MPDDIHRALLKTLTSPSGRKIASCLCLRDYATLSHIGTLAGDAEAAISFLAELGEAVKGVAEEQVPGWVGRVNADAQRSTNMVGQGG